MFRKLSRRLGAGGMVAVVALVIAVVGAAAWVSIFLFATRFAASTTSALSAPQPVGAWSCAKVSGTGAVIGTCAERSGSNAPEVVITGLSEDNLNVYAYRIYHNNNAVPITLTLVGAQNPKLPVTLQDNAGVPRPSIIAPASSDVDVYVGIRSLGIGPSESLDVTGLEFRWAP